MLWSQVWVSGQLLCWKDMRRGAVASENCNLGNGPSSLMEAFPSAGGQLFLFRCLFEILASSKEESWNHETERWWLGKKGQRGRMALICYSCSSHTCLSLAPSKPCSADWLTDSPPCYPAMYWGNLYFLGINSIVLSPMPESLSLKKNNNSNIM